MSFPLSFLTDCTQKGGRFCIAFIENHRNQQNDTHLRRDARARRQYGCCLDLGPVLHVNGHNRRSGDIKRAVSKSQAICQDSLKDQKQLADCEGDLRPGGILVVHRWDIVARHDSLPVIICSEPDERCNLS